MQLESFIVGDALGEGGMGTVFSGRHSDSGTAVAIKVVDAANAQGLIREAHTVAQLNHPNIIQLLDLGTLPKDCRLGPKGAPFFVMPFCGHTLLDRKRRPRTWTSLRALILAMLDALAHAHGHGVIHCDLKPTNILYGDSNLPKLADFGISYQSGDEERFSGTPSYMAPEQALGKDIGPWTDIFSLGVLVWRLAGGYPWGDSGDDFLLMHRAKVASARPPLGAVFSVPDGLEAWLHLMIQGAWQERYQSAAAAEQGFFELCSSNAPRASSAMVPAVVLVDNPTRWATAEISAPTNKPRYTPAPSAEFPKKAPIGDYSAYEQAEPGAALVGIREPRMVGRVLQRQELWQMFFETTRGDTAGWATVSGPDGSGRSRLVRWLARSNIAFAGGCSGQLQGHGKAKQILVAMLQQIYGVTDLELLVGRLRHLNLLSTRRVRVLERFVRAESWRDALMPAVRIVGWRAEQVPVVVWAEDIDKEPELAAIWDALVLTFAGAKRLRRKLHPVFWVATTKVRGDIELPLLSGPELHTICRQWASLPKTRMASLVRQSRGLVGRLQQMLLAEAEDRSTIPIAAMSADLKKLVAIAAFFSPECEDLQLFEAAIRVQVGAPIDALMELVERGILEYEGASIRFRSHFLLYKFEHLAEEAEILRGCAPVAEACGRNVLASEAYEELGMPQKALNAALLVPYWEFDQARRQQLGVRLERCLRTLLGHTEQKNYALMRIWYCLNGQLSAPEMLKTERRLVAIAQKINACGFFARFYRSQAKKVNWGLVRKAIERAAPDKEGQALRAYALVDYALYNPTLSEVERQELTFMAVQISGGCHEKWSEERSMVLCAFTARTGRADYLPEIRRLVTMIRFPTADAISRVVRAFDVLGEKQEALAYALRHLDVLLQLENSGVAPLVFIAKLYDDLGQQDEALKAARAAARFHCSQGEMLSLLNLLLAKLELQLGQIRPAYDKLCDVSINDLLHPSVSAMAGQLVGEALGLAPLGPVSDLLEELDEGFTLEVATARLPPR